MSVGNVRDGSPRAVVFDWGGVLIDNPTDALMGYCACTLGVERHDFAAAFAEYEHDFQAGRISEERLCMGLAYKLDVTAPEMKGSLWKEAVRTVFREREDVFALVRSLRAAGMKTGFLSNTEAPAMEHFHERKYGCFDAEVFSCAEGAAKPDARIYRLAAERLALPPEACVMIDDKQENIDGAVAAGMRGICYESLEQVKRDLAEVGVTAESEREKR